MRKIIFILFIIFEIVVIAFLEGKIYLEKSQVLGELSMKPIPKEDIIFSTFKHWVSNSKEGFIKLIEKFWSIPNWPENWKEQQWTT